VLREGGLSRAGALAMMGNIGPESGFNPKAAEGISRSRWDSYTREVDTGAISKNDFVYAGWGYGLAQWTLAYRRNKLYDFALMSNESIGSEWMQTKFIIHELTTEDEYRDLYSYLCQTEDLYKATSRICKEYERPTVNNIDARYKVACECANEPYDDPDGGDGSPSPVESDAAQAPPIDTNIESCEIIVRILRRGMKGRDVFVAQTAINDMGRDCGEPDGDFGPKTETGVRDLQEICELPVTGVIGQAEWQIIFQ
jgi:hypothetical protein